MARWLLVFALLAGSAGGVLLGALNPDIVDLNLLVWRWQASLGAVLAAGIGLGVCLGLFMGLLLRRRAGRSRLSSKNSPSRPSSD